MALLLGAIGCRTVGWFGLITFVPLWEVARGGSEGDGARMLAVMLVAGGIGTLAVGALGDWLGHRRVLLAALAALPPAILLYVTVGGVAGALGLALTGAANVGTFGLTTVMGQAFMPRHVAMASGLVVGLAMGLGGIGAVVLGALADRFALETSLLVCAFAAVPAFALAYALPRPSRARRLEPEAATP